MIPHWLNTPFVHALGWTLVHTLWQAMLIALIIRLLWLPVSQQRARLRYGLSLAGLLTILVCAAFTFGYYHQAYQPLAIDAQAWAFPDNLLPAEADILENDWSLNEEVLMLGEKSPDSMLQTLLYTLEAYLPWLVLTWLLGTILMGLRLAGGWWQLRRLSKKGLAPLPAGWNDRFMLLVEKMGIRRKVELRLSYLVTQPIALKHLKPVILFPVGLINQLTVEQVEVILLHELAHIRRWDYLVNWLQSILELLFFYHPAVWWLSREVREAREHCCDDLVLSRGSAQRMLYAQTLTQLTALSFTNRPTPKPWQRRSETKLAMSVKGINGAFTQRVKRLFGHYETAFDWRKPVLSAIVCVFILFGFSFSSNAIDNSAANDLPLEEGLISEEAITDSFEMVPFIRINDQQLAFSKTNTPFTLFHQVDQQGMEASEASQAFTSDEISYDPDTRKISARSMVIELKQPLTELWVNGESWGIDWQKLDQFNANDLETAVWDQNKNSLFLYSTGQSPTHLEGQFPSVSNLTSDTIPQSKSEISISQDRIDISKSPGKFDWYGYPKKISLTNQEEKISYIQVNKVSVDLTKNPQIILMDVNYKEVLDYQELENLDPAQIAMVKSYPESNRQPERIFLYTKRHLQRYPDSVPVLKVNPEECQTDIVLSAPFQTRPLIIIDGEVMGRDTNLLKNIDPNSIATINVHKRVGAMEVYGPEAEEGVIEVITKNGVEQNKKSSPTDQIKPALKMPEVKSTFVTDTEPLIILDGEVIERGDHTPRDGDNPNDFINDLVDPKDIEKIEVIKDAIAIQRYGQAAQNGVILITTKKSQQQQNKGAVSKPGKQDFVFVNRELLPAEQHAKVRSNKYQYISGPKAIGLYNAYGELIAGIPTPAEIKENTYTIPIGTKHLAIASIYPCDNVISGTVYIEKSHSDIFEGINEATLKASQRVNIEMIKKYCGEKRDKKAAVTIQKTTPSYPPGFKEELFMRGIRVNNPMYIVDGENWGRDPQKINTLKVDDIESINVLKGESAVKVYGEEGRNGVLIIDLKKPFSKEGDAEKNYPEEVKIQIRGKNSPNAKQPLFIIDGLKIGKDEKVLKKLDPNEIKSIDVFKGEKALEMYGDEGRDGVINIKTKTGQYAPTVQQAPLYVVNDEVIDPGQPWREIGTLHMRRLNFIPPKEAIKKYGEQARYGAVILQTAETKDWAGGKPYIAINKANLRDKSLFLSPHTKYYFIDGQKVDRNTFSQFNYLHFAPKGDLSFLRVGKIFGLKKRNANVAKIEKRYRDKGFVYEIGPGIVTVEFFRDCDNKVPVGLIYSSLGLPIRRAAELRKNRVRATTSPKLLNIKCDEVTVIGKPSPSPEPDQPPTLGPEMNVSLQVAQKIKGTFQAFPNPFKEETQLVFELPEDLKARISIFNSSGQLMKILSDDLLKAGRHEFSWNSSGAPSGSYIVMIEAGGSRITQTIQKQ